MMNWQAWKLTYQALSPTLVGAHRYGFIQRTRYYVPGWTLWGGLTATLTRAFHVQPGAQEYQDTGQFVEQNLLTSYAGILIDGKPALPEWNDGRWLMGPLSMSRFEARFLASYGQTGINPSTQTAGEGQLHETEVLSDIDLETRQRVRWQFILYMRSGALDEKGWRMEEFWQTVRHLSIGGDRSYGLGHWEMENREAVEVVSGNALPIPLDWNREASILRAHVPITEFQGIKVYGRAEVITRLLWRNTDTLPAGPGQSAESEEYCLPGCQIAPDSSWTPVIGPKGIWMREG